MKSFKQFIPISTLIVLPAIFVAWVGALVIESNTIRKELAAKVYTITVLRDIEESVIGNTELSDELLSDLEEVKTNVNNDLLLLLKNQTKENNWQTLDLLRKNIKELRINLNNKSIRLDTMWNQVTALGILACLVAIFSAILGWKFLKRSEQAKKQNIELQSTTLKLQEANISKNRLFAIIGHDLRSPVGTLQTMLEMLEKDLITNEEFLASISSLKKGVDGVHFTLNNLLLWAKSQLEGINPVFETVNLEKVVSNVVGLLESDARKKNLALDIHVNANHSIKADSNHVELIIRNLLSNAIKYSLAGGTINVDSSLHANKIRISITDQGIGLTQEEINEILGKGGKTELGTMGENGTGLGLMLCKEFVAKNNGTLNATGGIGKGTTFYFELPIAR
ncbi:MAG: HAMP domain-containing histidine kinase [Bacteroidetes bacterium]|nr:HAMP domain-containing histidine kinase [Bacteroidota bacterium]